MSEMWAVAWGRLVLSVLQAFGVGSALCDEGGSVLMADDAYLDLLRCDRSNLRSISREVITHPEDQARNHILLDKQRQDGQPFEIIKRYVRPGGEPVWVQNTVSLMHGNGTVRALVLSRPVPEENPELASPTQAGRLAFAGVISETTSTLGFQARRMSLSKTAGLLEAVADAAIPEAVQAR